MEATPLDIFCTFASGSGGNAALYASRSAKILVDAGTSTKYIAHCLGTLGLALTDLTHVLITHGHSDHTGALPVLGKHTRARLVCSEDTFYTLDPTGWEADVFTPGEFFDLNDVLVKSFVTPHDAMGSCGYVLGEGDKRVAYCTDLGDMLPSIEEAIRGSRTVVLESNHDIHMLKNGPYPPSLIKRILSPNGHLSNADCARTVASLAQSGARRVILAHLSEENNTPRLAFETNSDALTAAGVREAVKLAVAPVRSLIRCRL